jgi:hypothetical protein
MSVFFISLQSIEVKRKLNGSNHTTLHNSWVNESKISYMYIASKKCTADVLFNRGCHDINPSPDKRTCENSAFSLLREFVFLIQ